MNFIPDELVHEYVHFATCMLPECSRKSNNIIIAYADGGNHFTDYGIFEGTMMLFDQDLEYVDGHPSCFYDPEKKELKVLRHPEPGCIYAGSLITTMNHHTQNAIGGRHEHGTT